MAPVPHQRPTQFQRDNQRLTLGLIRDLRKLFGLLRSDPKQYRDVAGALVDQYAETASILGAEYFDDMAGLASIRAEPAVLSDPVPDEKMSATFDWALDADDDEASQKRIDGALQKLVVDAGRDTVTENLITSNKTIGYARLAEPGACHFCALLATRGVDGGSLYHTADSAMYKGNRTKGSHGGKRKRGQKTTETYGTDQYHDNCHCVPVPVFEGQEYSPPEHIREFDKTYRNSTGGYKGHDKMKAFRRAIENPAGGGD